MSKRTTKNIRWKSSVVALGATASLGFGAVAGAGGAQAIPLFSDTWGTFGLDHIVGLINDPTAQNYIKNSCSSGAEKVSANGVTVDCSRSTGNGTAVVLPSGIDLAANDQIKYTLTADGVPIQIGDGGGTSIDILFENMNLVNIVSGAALDPMFDLYNPLTAYEFTSYQQVVDAAALPVKPRATEGCAVKGYVYDYKCTWIDKLLGGVSIPAGTDENLAARSRALKVAGYLNNAVYDPTQPVVLGGAGVSAPAQGSATVVGDGVQLALAMTGGIARADAHLPWSIATAAAANGRNSHAQSVIGISNALNSDALGLTWFGSPLDLTKIMPLLALADADDLVALGNTDVPAFKEVSCYGVYARAKAEGLGSCTNILGTLDYYRDHNSGQRQFGITDVSSLVMGGNDALVKQLGDADSPFMRDLMKNLTTADSRLKFAKDFVRFTSNPVVDEVTGKTHTAYWLTSDYGLTAPVVIELAGYQLTLFPGETVNGAYRPNLIGLPELKKLGDDAGRGLLPKVSLVEFANPFGLGTLSFANPLNPIATVTDYVTSITVLDDLGNLAPLGGLVQDGLNARKDNEIRNNTPVVEPDPEPEIETTPVAPAAKPVEADDDAPADTLGSPSAPTVTTESPADAEPATSSTELELGDTE